MLTELYNFICHDFLYCYMLETNTQHAVSVLGILQLHWFSNSDNHSKLDVSDTSHYITSHSATHTIDLYTNRSKFETIRGGK